MHAEKNGGVRPTVAVTLTGSLGCDGLTADESRIECMRPLLLDQDFEWSHFVQIWIVRCCWILSAEPHVCDHPMPMRGISLASHRSSIMIISFHGMTAYQHHNVVLQSQPHGTDLMRCNTTCSLYLFPCLTRIVCSTSLTDDCIVTCRALLFLYCWRVRSFRFFCLTVESNCEGACGVDVTICWVAACLTN